MKRFLAGVALGVALVLLPWQLAACAVVLLVAAWSLGNFT